MLDYVLHLLYKDADPAGRRRIDLALAGRLGANGGEIVADPDLPESMQGLEAPAWWNSEDDPWAEQYDLSGTDASLHGVVPS